MEDIDMAFEYAVVLTGGIATGKSTVVNFFIEEGFYVIDADKIAHVMLDKHKNDISNLFGSKYIVDNRVDRKALGGLIFSEPKEKLRLEKLLHPLIFSEIEKLSIEQDKKKKSYLIDIPLFFESKGRYPIKKSILVYTSPNIQLERLMKRDSSSNIEAQQRIDSQISIEKKRALATYIIDNSKDLKNLQQECVRVKKQILIDTFKE
ncbi:Dephospho-CoA kinase [hydrothermal vent metagenome]|uniref:Dephospho-CoA kinase n=1 Tax=hydrothermal vent metagenome TaxID=652676 RepID=A0A1W1BVW7_9ZZZZ